MMLAMPLCALADDYERGDCDLDGAVDIADVNMLINYILTGSWESVDPNPEPQNVTFVLNGIEINMVYVEGGTFTMGASGADMSAADNEFPAHVVTLSPYYICTTEVTQQLWRAVMGNNPSGNKNNMLNPVETVSWTECQTFITKLNAMTGQTFRLPTEAEWEFAARGGNKSQGYLYSGSNTIGNVAWYTSNSSNKTHPVATKAPNELGLYDMSGNVLEWCKDRYGSYTSATAQDPQGPSSGSSRVVRGGKYGSSAARCRVSARNDYSPELAYDVFGLRLAM